MNFDYELFQPMREDLLLDLVVAIEGHPRDARRLTKLNDGDRGERLSLGQVYQGSEDGLFHADASLIWRLPRHEQYLQLAYFISVVALTVVNRFFGEKASGHACSTMGSLSFAVFYIGPIALAPCIILFAAMAWSSVKLGRHTPRNIASGSMVFLAALCVACAVMLCLGVNLT